MCTMCSILYIMLQCVCNEHIYIYMYSMEYPVVVNLMNACNVTFRTVCFSALTYSEMSGPSQFLKIPSLTFVASGMLMKKAYFNSIHSCILYSTVHTVCTLQMHIVKILLKVS